MEALGLVLLTSAVIGVGAWMIWLAKRWRNQLLESRSTEPLTLASYQQMLDDGLLDEEEFARIKARLEAPDPPTPTSPTDEGIRILPHAGAKNPPSNGEFGIQADK